MQYRRLLQVLLCVPSLILSMAQGVLGSGPSCLRSRRAEDGVTRVTFLQEDAAGARSLYLSLWSGDMRPVTCEVHTDPLVTERYRAFCDRSQEIAPQMFNVSALLAPDAPCALVSSGAPKFNGRVTADGTEGKSRRKRSWIFPGTLWCGTGSRAAAYEQLGMFEKADKCCREHDHCQDTIPAFKVNYGVFNPKFFTVSHCDCDQRFRQCLLDVNDSISSMVGYSFFSILQVPCFELKQKRRCTKMSWWGKCKVAQNASYAFFKTPLPYTNTTDVKTNGGKSASSDRQHVTESPVIHTKSLKGAHRCSFKDPPRGDTFYRRRTKEKGCKKVHREAPYQILSTSGAPNTTPFHASNSSTLMSNKKRAGKKKSSRKGLLVFTTQRSQVSPGVTTNSYPQTTSTTQGTPSTTLQHLTKASLAETKNTKSHKKVPKRSRCCRVRMPLRGDSFQPHCKKCPDQNVTTVTPSTTTYGPAIKGTTRQTLQLKKTTRTPKQDIWSTATPATPVTTKLKRAASIHIDVKLRKKVDSHLLQNNTSQELKGGTTASNTPAEKGLKPNTTLHNVTDNQLLCGSLKHLDECRYKIPPLEKKYDLQNMESKTAYHCDCISRLAVQIESFKQPSVLPTLLMDFVSQYCFKLPKEKKCHTRKSCSGSFTKASDLLRALKKIEEKDTAGVRTGSHRKRGIPVRLYKRCLRLEREAHIMAQLTRL